MADKKNRSRVAAGNVVAQFSITKAASVIIDELAKSQKLTRSGALMRIICAFGEPSAADKKTIERLHAEVVEKTKAIKQQEAHIEGLEAKAKKADFYTDLMEFAGPVEKMVRDKFADGMSVKGLSELTGVPVRRIEDALRGKI